LLHAETVLVIVTKTLSVIKARDIIFLVSSEVDRCIARKPRQSYSNCEMPLLRGKTGIWLYSTRFEPGRLLEKNTMVAIIAISLITRLLTG